MTIPGDKVTSPCYSWHGKAFRQHSSVQFNRAAVGTLYFTSVIFHPAK